MGAGEEYERLADAFYRDTGMMAPGKDKPAALAGIGASIEERRERWQAWLDARRTRSEADGGEG